MFTYKKEIVNETIEIFFLILETKKKKKIFQFIKKNNSSYLIRILIVSGQVIKLTI